MYSKKYSLLGSATLISELKSIPLPGISAKKSQLIKFDFKEHVHIVCLNSSSFSVEILVKILIHSSPRIFGETNDERFLYLTKAAHTVSYVFEQQLLLNFFIIALYDL